MGEVVDASIKLYLQNFGKLLLIAAAVVVPVTVAIFALDLVALQEADGSGPGAALYEVGGSVRLLDESRFLAATIAQGVISFVAYLLIIGAMFRAVSEAYLGRPIDVRASLGLAARRAHSLLWVGILSVVGVMLGLIALILPGIWLLVAWSVAVPALMVEGLKGTKALGRSFGLTRSHWVRTLGALIVGFIFIGLIEFLLGLAAAGLDSLAEDDVYLWAAALDVVNGLSLIVTAPLQAAIVTVIYYDLRVRKEGFDVQLLAEQLDRPSEAPPAAAPPAREAPQPALGSAPPPAPDGSDRG